ncbi:oxidase [Lithospermum erythrorhizon]|uniref:Oxidase n=1 Tax=Lithospermum erythrorhizon TaxID=34254 RepID=A0AAV3PHW9_LITER
MYSCSLSTNRRRCLKHHQGSSSLELPKVESYPEPGTFRLKVTSGKTYLLRIISASVDPCIFFKIANHNMVIVANDASYTNPFRTDVIIISPGQTIDVLLTANQPPGLYYMTTTVFVNSKVKFRDIPWNLVTSPFWAPVPLEVDEHMLITIGLGFQPCSIKDPTQICNGTTFLEYRMSGSLNNITFRLPTKMSLLEAHYNKDDGIYTSDFPNKPPLTFNFTDERYRFDLEKLMTELGTKVKRLKYNSSVEIVFQSTTLITPENHPMHLHGFNFHILGQGFGNYDPSRHREKLNYLNPILTSTVSVPSKVNTYNNFFTQL